MIGVRTSSSLSSFRVCSSGEMKSLNSVTVLSDPASRSCFCSLFITATLICGVYFTGNAFFAREHKEGLMKWAVADMMHMTKSGSCKNKCRPPGTEALPQGIVVKTADLEMRPLWSYTSKQNKPKRLMSLLAIAVGIKQKEIVDQIVKKFPLRDFVVMLFHYDGVVEEWNDLSWSDHAIHVSAVNQTKWWFAKRFLHPDIVDEYHYIFLWDEDIGVEHFNPRRYLTIIKKEGFEISQPALDPIKSEVHHPITARRQRSMVHRRMYKFKGSGRCDDNSTAPPCIGWVEMMAPVFSKAAWRCAWYMIQNDLIHAWGLDKQLGYCAQSNTTSRQASSNHQERSSDSEVSASESHRYNNRPEVRRQSYIEMQIFSKRWTNAVREDKCWIDPYPPSPNKTIH